MLSVRILSELTSKAEKRASLFARLEPEKLAFDSCETIVTTSGLVIPKRARGHDIWVSPAYFADNLDAVADMAATGDSPRIARLLKLARVGRCRSSRAQRRSPATRSTRTSWLFSKPSWDMAC